jgi:hypothetical protein
MEALKKNTAIRTGFPNFEDLPWKYGLSDWHRLTSKLVDIPTGISRHTVLIVEYEDTLYAFKELLSGEAQKEYNILWQSEHMHLPVVQPVGYVETITDQGARSVLITRFLDGSLPYRMLFMQPGLESYQRFLLDAVASLLVQLHLAGLYWGDCSLSNTLFRRDAGTLQAYLVDAETSEYFPNYLPPAMRIHDLQIMDDTVTCEFIDLEQNGFFPRFEPRIPLDKTGAYISLQYQKLWEQITVDEIIDDNENFRIQERVRTLNKLGFSVGDIELERDGEGNQLRFRVVVTDRNFHRNQLKELTCIDAEELQAQIMMNEIQELRAIRSQQISEHISLKEAAAHWLEQIYQPITERLAALMDQHTTLSELYCQLLEHKWYISEQANHDVGHYAAVDDFIYRFSPSNK